jgi:hypothetical protein
MSLLSVPLAGAGWLAAHSGAYLLAAPDGHERAELLSATGHGYLAHAPLFCACGAALVVAGLLACVTDGVRGHARVRQPLRLFVLMPVLGFATVEHLERLVAHDAFPYDAVLEPTFLIGLALQLPFAFVAFGFAHVLHGLGHVLGRLMRGWAKPACRLRVAQHALVVTRLIPEPARPLPLGLARGHAPRAPPAPSGA